VVGESACSTSAGVHAHTTNENPGAYAPFPPEKFGNKQRMTLTMHSGRAVIRGIADSLKITISDAQVLGFEKRYAVEIFNGVYENNNATLILDLLEISGEHGHYFKTHINKIVTKGKTSTATISVTFTHGKNKVVTATAKGNGQFDAVTKALKKILVERRYRFLRNTRL
ncbi:MAG: hypothetical protein NT091_03565, partial [Candidatus Falkowbacteria bacterium]|nr:hypothetical protein [Candidatus Falkowbacteria bacterium]